MLLDPKTFNQLIDKLEEVSPNGLFLGVKFKNGENNRLNNKFFFFHSVVGKVGEKGIYIGEKIGTEFEEHVPMMVVFVEETSTEFFMSPFEGNHLTAEEAKRLVINLSLYLDRAIPEEQIKEFNTSELNSIPTPSSTTKH